MMIRPHNFNENMISTEKWSFFWNAYRFGYMDDKKEVLTLLPSSKQILRFLN